MAEFYFWFCCIVVIIQVAGWQYFSPALTVRLSDVEWTIEINNNNNFFMSFYIFFCRPLCESMCLDVTVILVWEVLVLLILFKVP